MRHLAVGAGLLSTLLAASQDTATVPMQVRDGGYLHVGVRLADAVEATFMVDTAAGINTLSPELVGRLGDALRPAGRHSGTRHNGEVIEGPVWTLSSLQLGSVTKHDVLVGEFAPAGSDGLLSLDFFRDLPFTLDFPRERLVIETPDGLAAARAAGVAIPVQLKANGPHQLDMFVDICIGDVRATAEFDTGAGFNMLMMQPSFMDRLGIAPPAGASRGPLEYYVHSTFLPAVAYCAAPAVSTTRQFVGFKEGLIHQALIGHGAFRGRRLTIDVPHERMLVW